MNIYLVAGQHGDELFGLKILGRLLAMPHSTITMRVAHPEAVAKRVRYLQQDLNRSFGKNDGSLEARIAGDIAADICAKQPDLVIDIHSSISDVAAVAIVAQHNKLLQQAAAILGMQAMVVMPSDLIASSMLGCLPQAAISLEFGKNCRSDKLAAATAARIADLAAGKFTAPDQELPLFEVHTTIPKDYAGLATITNLQLNADLGGYPFLAGPHTYPSIGGFLAREIQ